MEVSQGEDKKEDYGLIRPSLIKQLRAILDQYPDNGQILKELLQNAEDAGAKTVRFIYDQHSYGCIDLHHPEMAQFQGPALYAYNDALFSEQDWIGIRMLQESIKESDSMKIGRFGLGFKSCLHLTDLPSVLSGEKLFFIDPHEKYFLYKGCRTSGYLWNLKERKREMLRVRHHFEPFHDILSMFDESFNDGFFRGTLFRFPLRQTPSELCSTVYDEDRVDELFAQFESDAHLFLIFLKNIEKLELYVRRELHDKPQLLFKLSIKAECLDTVRRCRKCFIETVKLTSSVKEDVSITYPLDICTMKYHKGGELESKTFHFLVNEFHVGTATTQSVKSLREGLDLSLIPLVGVAMEINKTQGGESEKLKLADKENVADVLFNRDSRLDDECLNPKGQVFCFLPLPKEEKSASGLPVHVNGYFAISQNRRHLKWPSHGQKVEKDKSLLWNHCLLSEVLPLSYKELLVHAIRSTKVSVRDIYLAIPNLVVVNEKWQVVLEPFFRMLFDLSVFHTALGGGKWIGAEECIFDCMREDPESRKMILDILICGGIPVVEVKQHILHALGAYSNHSPEIITPGILRDVLRGNLALYRHYDRERKHRLLRYILKEEDFAELNGIELLPLLSGQFIKFNKMEQLVYISTDEFPASLLPNLSGQIVADDLDDYSKQKFYKLVQSGCSQVRYLTADSVAALVRKAIPNSWFKEDSVTFDDSQIPADWLPLIWKYLRTHYPSDLSKFMGLPILPITSDMPVTLVPLSETSCAVLQTALGASLSSGIERILRALGAHVVLELPQFVRDHAGIIGTYVKVPVTEDIVEVLYNACRRKDAKQVMDVFHSTITESEKLDLVALISQLQPKCIDRKYLVFLSQLPIFRCLGDTSDNPRFVSVTEVRRAATVKQAPLAMREKYLDASAEAVCKAALLLGATVVNSTTILKEVLAAQFKTGATDVARGEIIAKDIFQRFSDYCSEDPSLPAMLSNVPFVKTGCGRMEQPSRLFDAESGELRQILAGADVFPGEFYAQPQNLQHLRKMGLKSEKDLTPEDLLNAMRRIEQTVKTADHDQTACDSSVAILNFLNRNPSLLWKDIGGKMLVEHCSNVSWVAILREKPAFFPVAIDMFSGRDVYAPCQVKNTEWLPVIGAVRPIVAVQCTFEVAQAFGWDASPNLDVIVEQLGCVVCCYNSQQKVQFLTMIMAVYEFLCRFNAKDICKSIVDHSLQKWIWHGNGFASVEELTLFASAIDLQPFVFVLPSELQPYVEFFASCGVAERCNHEILVKTLHRIKVLCDADKEKCSQRILAMVVNILNVIAKDGVLPDVIAQLDLLIPCGVDDGSGMRLLPVSDCTYCDVDWVRKGFNLLDFDDSDGINFIHPQLPTSTAETLQVPTLMSRMLNAEELEISSFGQSEPLTSRLKKLLEDYSDGLAIPKELIQNADDAGATEVRFLYDERQNQDAMKYLIDEGMKACQGPALWAYNDAVFTDKDFDNIVRLGGATKQMETDKIGKFGLGFNAVYNITDVPSFVTRNAVVIFDPHTVHLGRGIRDRSKPGIKLDLRRNETLLRKLPDQFRPYRDVFGCKIFDGGEKSFPGTLFRLPLRTREQAARSEISGLHYDREQVIGLLDMLIHSAPYLLLFTQSVQKLSFYYLPNEGSPLELHKVLTAEKNAVRIVRDVVPLVDGKELQSRENGEKILSCNGRMLQASSEFLNKIKSDSKKNRKLRSPKSSVVVKISVSLSSDQSGLVSRPPEDAETSWLISQSFGKGSSFQKALKSNEGFIPVAGVACLLKQQEDCFVPVSIDGTNRSGRVFCFLPIPMSTQLPVHINGCFALHSDRRCLSFKTEDDKSNVRVEWNQALLEDSVTAAYIQLLQDVAFLLPPSFESGVFDIWPSADVDPSILPLVESFYRSAANISLNVPLLYSGSKPVPTESVVILENSNDNAELFQSVASQILSCGLQQGKKVGLMTDGVMKTFGLFQLDHFVEERIYSIERFFRVIFLPNICAVSGNVRDMLIIFAVSQNSVALDDLIRVHACIPASPDGQTLRKPCELVHPSSPLSHLFDPEDGRFPYGDSFCTPVLLNNLEKLGMRSTNITWEDVTERSVAMQALFQRNADKAKTRLEMLLMFIDRILLREQKGLSEKSVSGLTTQNEAQEMLMEIAFLPCLTKPANFPLKWISDDGALQLHCPSDLYTFENRYLVSATSCIVDDKRMSYRVRDFFKLNGKKATIEQVLSQMEHAFDEDVSKLSPHQYEELQNCVFAIYGFLQEQCNSNHEFAEQVCAILIDRRCILIDGVYVYPNQVSINFAYNCTPYLYGLSRDFVNRFHPLLKMLGVKEQFDIKDYMSAIHNLKESHGDSVLNAKDLGLSIRLVSQLNNAMKMRNVSAAKVQAEHGVIYIPSIKGTLQPASSLCYNDCPWITETSTMNFAHPEITFQTSACLGVRTKCQEALRRNAHAIPFGQRERLTNSLKRILRSYPFDQEILKELIQNADDAGATVIHFVKDSRQHPTNHVFDQQWKPLQGPALCVYNNSPFTDKDLVGIQQLGEGSKSLDFCKTGQYGIGFSSVYHLTDAPSLLTTGLDGYKKLCVFDPHCRYVPGATQTEPGMQFENIEDLREAFPDVFRCYLEDQFSAKGSTIFRLPLRTKEMAEDSEISKTTVNIARVQTILKQLKEELFEILLFTNHLEEVIISDVDPNTGLLVNSYVVKALVSKEDRRKRLGLAEIAQKCAESLKAGQEFLEADQTDEATCTVVMSDNTGMQEKWLVVQRFGFGVTTLPEEIKAAVKNGELALLPRGGVACLMERRQHGRIEPASRPNRVFCFLPLPIETDLPVHINGHFALGYENRRHLWTNTENDGYKRMWNDLLCTGVIAPAYASLMKALRMVGLSGTLENDIAHVSCSQQILDAAIKAYLAYLPGFSDVKPQWNVLTKATYQSMAGNNIAMLPCICEESSSQALRGAGPHASNEVQRWQITWLPPNGVGTTKAFFRKNATQSSTNEQKMQASFIGKVKNWFGKPWTAKEKSNDDILRDALLDCGLKLIEATDEVCENFCRSGVDIDYMTPDGILLFFSSYACEEPMCYVGELPQPLPNTPFQNEKTLVLVLDYIKKASSFENQLAGLPLLLTSDNMLRQFSDEDPVLYSKFSDLLPNCSHRFLKPTLIETFSTDLLTGSDVFQEFRICDLAEMLHLKLPRETFSNGNEKVDWVKTYSSVPTEKWMQMLWTYISSQLESLLKDCVTSPHDKTTLVTKELAPLKSWCIVPARSPAGNCLYSVESAKLIVDFGSREYQTLGFRSVVQKLRLPQLDINAVNSDYCNNLDVLQHVVTTLDKPGKMVNLLQRHFTDEIAKPTVLTKEDCDHVLKYLCENVETIKSDEFAAEKIRSLPIFRTIFGDVIRLTDCLVYTLPAKIPTNGVDIWQSKSGTVFLERNDKFQDLYGVLGCATISVIDVYCQFIFQHFEYFSLEDRLVHLHHIYVQYLQESYVTQTLSDEEKEGLLESLRQLPFLEDESGELQCASHFYDPENVVLKIMEPAGRFAPKASKMFKESEWYSFLAMLGMVREVSSSMFLEFTRTVANEGQNPKSSSALVKSKVLVQHLFALPDETRDPILDHIVDVPFVATEAASSNLLELFPQHGDLGGGKLAYAPFRNSISKVHEKLCWTCANLLPPWADPSNQNSMSQGQKEQILQKLAVQKLPNVKTVLSHLELLCHDTAANGLPLANVHRTTRMEVFRAIYKHLMNQEDSLPEIREKLEKIRCILVDDARAFVFPRQTVINIYDTEEIRPYLYKLPVELGEYQRLFIGIGTTNRATASQYVEVMDQLKTSVGTVKLTPNELRTAFKAVKGLLETLENSSASDLPGSCLYLPSEKGKLQEATRLVFNDAPSFYDRVKEYNLQFLFDVRECGIRARNIDEMVGLLPMKMRPAMLSTYVQEVLVPSSRQVISAKGMANLLSQRLKSVKFLEAIIRLIRHEAHKKGKKLDEGTMFNVLDRLSVISVYTVPNVTTHLCFKGKPIAGSELEKPCFVERLPGATTDLHTWNIYVRDVTTFSQEMLIPLAEVVNSILSGMLHDSVLYLLPILSCPEEQIQTKLDDLNIRLDHSTKVVAKTPTLPLAGTPVSEEIQSLCSWGQVDFFPEEYIAYRDNPDDPFIYGVVLEELMSPDDNRIYLVNLGNGRDGVISSVSKLFKFMRK